MNSHVSIKAKKSRIQKKKELEEARMKASKWARKHLFSPPMKKIEKLERDEHIFDDVDDSPTPRTITFDLKSLEKVDAKKTSNRHYDLLSFVKTLLVFMIGFVLGCASSEKFIRINGCFIWESVQQMVLGPAL